MAQLTSWAQKHTTAQDLIVLEASGNSFQVVRTLAAVGRVAKVLESCQMGKLKEAHANNDKISAVRIGKAYLAGTAKEVWVPDPKTQEWRDWFHAYRKATKRTTQMRSRLRSYLSDNGVRLKEGTRLTKLEEAEAQIRQARPWSGRQWQVIEIFLAELRHADQQRQHWHSLIAQEVLAEPELLALVRLCGVREIIAFALAAFIGDIKRFASPKKLVKYVGLNPAFDDSGDSQWSGGIGGHGHKLLRSPAHRRRPGDPALQQNRPGPLGPQALGRQGQRQPGRRRHRPQTHRGRLVPDDGPLDGAGGTGCTPAPQSQLHDQRRRSARTQSLGQNPQSLPGGNLPAAQNRPAPMSWTQTKSMPPSPRLTRLKSMSYDEFIALDPGLLRHPAQSHLPAPPGQAAPGADASAFQGRLSAQVALLQSPILPAADSLYPQQNETFRSIPVDNTHTRDSGEAPAGLRRGCGEMGVRPGRAGPIH